jgi:hypothetical protein
VSPTNPSHAVRGLDHLQRVSEYPAITLIAGAGPAGERRTRLEALARVAQQRLEREFGPDDPLVAALTGAIAAQNASVPAGTAPVAVFVSRSHASWIPIPGPARERVVIDQTFATRDLVHARLRAIQTWVLQLGATSHLFAGTGQSFARHEGGGFPVTETSEAGRGRQRHQLVEPHRLRHRHDRHQIRAIDDALDVVDADDPRPIIIIGARRRIDAFTAQSRHRTQCIAAIPWVGPPLDGPRLGALVRPTLDRIADDQTRRAASEVSAAIGRSRLTTGLHNCWRAASDGLADLLVVEESYEPSARLAPGIGTIEETDDRDAPGVVDDAVDELVEMVLGRGGRVTIVPDGTLGDLGRLAICTRA